MMILLKFRVTNFRSVDDSGWIEVDNVTSLIGTNESGKTNLLLPLWKLNPAKDGEIKPTADYPRKRYNEIRSMDEKPVFIEAHFELPETLAKKVANLTGSTIDDVRIALVEKRFDGTYIIGFYRDYVYAIKKTLYASEQESPRVQELRHEHRALAG
ncbi:AAA family ATPase [Scytonema sp. PCC 10023]|uniref:AAA family ATPase n=1 Tax=Scytonema sp. PCC 10023 TaxID=1680591 RepID=UPI0039C74FB5